MLLDQQGRALGVLIDGLAEIAFGDTAPDFDAETARDLLRKAGLLETRPATQDDVDACPFGVTEIGDPWDQLTPFASECRRAATEG